ncbi:MAG: hypothetical protein AAFZ07_22325 [Actinomycetota bacterium]
MTPLTRRRRALPAALLAGALGLAACGGGGSDGSTDAAAEPAEAAPLTPAESSGVSVAELEFVASTLDGGQLDGTTLAGTDTIVWFWAPW